jgi:hypothetical protein
MKSTAKIIIAVVLLYICFSTLQENSIKLSSPKPVSDNRSFEMVNHNSPPSIQMAYYIQKYANQYNIPVNYAFGIAYAETHYQGPYHWKYNPHQVSCVGALGPMQIMPATGAGNWKGRTVTREMLLNDIEFNVHTSMKLLRKLHNRYSDWKLVFGCYNTGRPCVNDYAIKVYNFSPAIATL